MRICLVNPKGPAGTMKSVPHGLLQICAELKSRGHHVDIADYTVADLAFDHLAHYDLVGISAMTTQLPHAIRLAEHLKRRTRVVWGGVHATIDPLSILNRFREHFVVAGEGESPLLDIIEHLEGRQSLDWLASRRGVCLWRDNRPVINPLCFIDDLNTLADVNYFDLPQLDLYLKQWNYFFQREINNLPVLAARGCHWNCAFCINALFRAHGGSYRTKSIGKIRREAEPVLTSRAIRFVEPRDEDFFLDRELLNGWLDFARQKEFLWSANGRFNYIGATIGEDRLAELVAGGLYSMGMSIEAGDERIRNAVLNKRVADAQIIKALDIIKRKCGSRLVVATSFIINFPGDTLTSRRKVIGWMEYLSREVNVVFSGPQAYRSYPGSPLYEKEKRRYSGDLDYYLDNLAPDGSAKTLRRKWSGLFYQEILMQYFNSRFRPLILGGDCSWSVSDQTHYRVAPLLETLMKSIKWRLKRECWRLFADPAIIGWLYINLPKLQASCGRIRRVFSQIRAGVFGVPRMILRQLTRP